MNTNEKIKVIIEIAKHLNQQDVTWTIGGSSLLYFNNLIEDFNDLDILIKYEDLEVVTKILRSIGTQLKLTPSANYQSEAFLKFIIDGLEVDVIAGFTIINNNKKYYFPLLEEQIMEYRKVEDTIFPLHSLKAWRTYYQLMSREQKADLIK